MRGHGAAIDAEADALLARAESTPWSGLAADAMRLRARTQVAALRRTAGLHDEAATALERHADEVDRIKALIAAIEHKVLALVEAAKDRLGGLVDAVAPRPGRRAAGPVRAPTAGPSGLAGRRSTGAAVTDDPVVVDVTGGAGGVAASYAAARALADFFDEAGDRLRD